MVSKSYKNKIRKLFQLLLLVLCGCGSLLDFPDKSTPESPAPIDTSYYLLGWYDTTNVIAERFMTDRDKIFINEMVLINCYTGKKRTYITNDYGLFNSYFQESKWHSYYDDQVAAIEFSPKYHIYMRRYPWATEMPIVFKDTNFNVCGTLQNNIYAEAPQIIDSFLVTYDDSAWLKYSLTSFIASRIEKYSSILNYKVTKPQGVLYNYNNIFISLDSIVDSSSSKFKGVLHFDITSRQTHLLRFDSIGALSARIIKAPNDGVVFLVKGFGWEKQVLYSLRSNNLVDTFFINPVQNIYAESKYFDNLIGSVSFISYCPDSIKVLIYNDGCFLYRIKMNSRPERHHIVEKLTQFAL